MLYVRNTKQVTLLSLIKHDVYPNVMLAYDVSVRQHQARLSNVCPKQLFTNIDF